MHKNGIVLISHHTYAALCDEIALLAGVLWARGIALDDQIIISIPMVPEAVIARRYGS